MAINAYKKLVIGKKLADIYEDFGGFWRELTSETQLRWVYSEFDIFNLFLYNNKFGNFCLKLFISTAAWS